MSTLVMLPAADADFPEPGASSCTAWGADERFDQVVVVAPHPDDESLASGLLLARAASLRIPVTVLAVTDGEAAYPDDAETLAVRRRTEQAAAAAELGITADRIERLGLPDGQVRRYHDRLVSAIVARLGDGNTTLLVAPSIHDWHPDHEACAHASRGAVTCAPRSVTVTLWSSLFWAHHHPGPLLATNPRLVRLTGTPAESEARCRAVARHRSQFVRAGTVPPILTAELVAHLHTNVELYVAEQPIAPA